jgi:signal transduction histidine kinase
LDISKIESGKLELKKEELEVNKLIETIISSFKTKANEKGLAITAEVPQETIKINADNDKLIQVFTNLVNNALKFTNQGYVKVSLTDIGNEVLCSVSDTGIGIARENLPKIFSKFQQFGRVAGPGEKGTGLGLSIAKGIVELHKGKIWVESEEGKGTKFIFTLPKA